jgi:hypothetical protein
VAEVALLVLLRAREGSEIVEALEEAAEEILEPEALEILLAQLLLKEITETEDLFLTPITQLVVAEVMVQLPL